MSEDQAVQIILDTLKEEGFNAEFGGDIGVPVDIKQAVRDVIFIYRSQIELVESERDMALRELEDLKRSLL